ncbi:MAG: YecA family protein [Massilia sp.]|nr:YecA family protein [Massilia sp.]
MQYDQPLSEKEFNELDQFLLSDRSSDDAMTMDTLHGFLTAIAIGPETIMPSEWLPNVWGEDNASEPKWKNAQEAERIFELIMRFMNEVAVTFEVAPKEFEPLFCEHEHGEQTLIDAEAWCWGFWEGMELRPGSWDPIWESDLAPLMRPIYLLGADEIEEEELKEVDDPVKGHKLALEIEANLPAIYKFWLPLRKSAVQTIKRDEPKVGRNDDCPCGSGKKYKKCCGADQAE